MKKLLIRSAVLLTVAALGGVAIWQVQRSAPREASAAEAVGEPGRLPAVPARAMNTLAATPGNASGGKAASDPFAGLYDTRGVTAAQNVVPVSNAAPAQSGGPAPNAAPDSQIFNRAAPPSAGGAGMTASLPPDQLSDSSTAVEARAGQTPPWAKTTDAATALPNPLLQQQPPAGAKPGDARTTSTPDNAALAGAAGAGRMRVNPPVNRGGSAWPAAQAYHAAADDSAGGASTPGGQAGTALGARSPAGEPRPLSIDPFAQPANRVALPPARGSGPPSAAQRPSRNGVINTSQTTSAPANDPDGPAGDPPFAANTAPQGNPFGSAAAAAMANREAAAPGMLPTEDNTRSVNENAEGVDGTGRPGGKHLEGPQAPQVTMQKVAPAEIQVGKPATFKILLRNTGPSPAVGIEVHDQVPRGTRVISTSPKAQRGVRGDLVWSLGTLKPGEEIAVEEQLMPTAEGEIGSVASVQFGADISARTIATRPQLVVETSAPPQVLLGEEALLRIVISNPGTGAATGVVLQEHIPQGLQHQAGGELEYEIGVLKPGESRKLDLPLRAAQPGQTTNILTAVADAGLRVEDRCTIEVTAPQLDVALDGPKKRYLEREAAFQIAVHNPGTAPAEKVDLVAYLPTGLKFVGANNSGHYDEASRAVHWRLEELPVQETGTVELTTMPVESGQQTIKIRGSAEKGLVVEHEHPVQVEGLAAILFQAADTVDPVEVGGETTYEIRVTNQGSKEATNVRLAVNLPRELAPVAAEGPTQNRVNGAQVLFDGLARLGPKAEAIYRVRVKGVAPGDLRTSIQLMTDEMQTPVTKEESTRVYGDE